MLELLFDLLYVFAIAQVVAFVAGSVSVLILTLSILVRAGLMRYRKGATAGLAAGAFGSAN